MSPKPTILITGAAGGIGTAFVAAFLRSPHALTHHALYLHHPTAPGSLSTLHPPEEHTYEIVPLDLSLMAAIRGFCAALNARVGAGELGPVERLVLIAGGIFVSGDREGDGLLMSEEGIEMTFAVNYLANFLLSYLLLPSLAASVTVSSLDSGARLVFAGSTTHDPRFKSNAFAIEREAHRVLFDGVDGLAKGTYQPACRGSGVYGRFGASLRRYGSAKVCLVLWMYAFQRYLNASPKHNSVTVIAHDPGAVGGTGHYEAHAFPLPLFIALKYLLVPIQALLSRIWPGGPIRSPAQVGEDLVWNCWGLDVREGEGREEGKGKGKGALYVDGRRVVGSSAESRDVEKQERLWLETCRLLCLPTLDMRT